MSAKKAWEETWHLTAYAGVGDIKGPPYTWIGGFVRAGFGASEHDLEMEAKAALAAAAPEMARMLLDLQWNIERRCPHCWGPELGEQHKPNCRLVAVLRKAGVLP